MNNDKKRTILESWYLVDFALFPDEPKNKMQKETYRDYLTSKGAFLSGLFELYHVLGYKPKEQCYANLTELYNHLEDRVESTNTDVVSILKTPESITSLKEELQEIGYIKEANQTDMASYIVSRRQKLMVLDGLFLKECLESASKELLENWRFKLLYNSYKSFRNTVVEHCFPKG